MNHTLKIKPLSVNQAWQGKRFKTDLYNDFIQKMHFILPNEIEIQDKKNIKIAIEFGFSSKASDIDNCIKSFLDCLVKKYKFDDRDIQEMHVFKSITKKGEEFIRFKIY
jgi:Holliday junction resolvase RusA-like endonuclease